MILQYKGFNNNWIFEDSDRIGTTKLNLNDFLGKPEERKVMDGLFDFKKAYDDVDKIIRSETGEFENKIIYLVKNVPIAELELVAVVMLENKMYVLNSESYLLNDAGKTIIRVF